MIVIIIVIIVVIIMVIIVTIGIIVVIFIIVRMAMSHNVYSSHPRNDSKHSSPKLLVLALLHTTKRRTSQHIWSQLLATTLGTHDKTTVSMGARDMPDPAHVACKALAETDES